MYTYIYIIYIYIDGFKKASSATKLQCLGQVFLQNSRGNLEGTQQQLHNTPTHNTAIWQAAASIYFSFACLAHNSVYDASGKNHQNIKSTSVFWAFSHGPTPTLNLLGVVHIILLLWFVAEFLLAKTRKWFQISLEVHENPVYLWTLNQETTCTKLLATFAPSGGPGWVESGYHLHPEQKLIQKGELLFLVGVSRSLSALTEIQTLDTEILPKLCRPARMPWRLFLASTRDQRFKHACACFLPSSLLLNILLTNHPFSFLLLFSEMGTYTAYVVTYDI